MQSLHDSEINALVYSPGPVWGADCRIARGMSRESASD